MPWIVRLLQICRHNQAVLGLLDTDIWTRDGAIEAVPRRKRAIQDKENIRWLSGGARLAE